MNDEEEKNIWGARTKTISDVKKHNRWRQENALCHPKRVASARYSLFFSSFFSALMALRLSECNWPHSPPKKKKEQTNAGSYLCLLFLSEYPWGRKANESRSVFAFTQEHFFSVHFAGSILQTQQIFPCQQNVFFLSRLQWFSVTREERPLKKKDKRTFQLILQRMCQPDDLAVSIFSQ